MNPLDTHVDGDTGAVRSAADGIGALSSGLGEATDGFTSAVSLSGSIWSGAAGDAFRGKVTSAAQASQVATTTTQQVQQALATFADQMDQVKATMAQAESVAAGAGLTVAEFTIQPPQPPTTNACYSAAGAAAAIARYTAQRQAFTRAEALIAQARQQEQAAQQAVTEVTTAAQNTLTTLDDDGYWYACGDLDELHAAPLKVETLEDITGLLQHTSPQDSDSLPSPQDVAPELTKDPTAASSGGGFSLSSIGDSIKNGVVDLGGDIVNGINTSDRISGTGSLLNSDGEDEVEVATAGIGSKTVDAVGKDFDVVKTANDALHGNWSKVGGDLTSLGFSGGFDAALDTVGVDLMPETGGLSILGAAFATGIGDDVTDYLSKHGG